MQPDNTAAGDKRLRVHALLEEALVLLDELDEQHAAIDVDSAICKLGLRPLHERDGHQVN